MSRKSIIIIGAGLTGLSTGCYAQMNGYESRILEHHTYPGGVAAAWRRGDHLIGGGIHFVMGHKPGTPLYELYRQLAVLESSGFVDLTTYGRLFGQVSGRSVTVTQDAVCSRPTCGGREVQHKLLCSSGGSREKA